MDRTRDYTRGLVWCVPSPEERVSLSEVIWHTLGALIVGVVLGLLIVVRYDKVCGLSQPACAVIRSVVLTATWTGANCIYPDQP